MKRRSGKNGFLLLCFLCIVLAILVVLFALFDRVFTSSDAHGGNDIGSGAEILYYNSIPYIQKDTLETVLFIGLDANGTVASQTEAHLADFLMLAVIDHAEKTVQFLHLNRDTMAYIDALNDADAPSAALYTQLARGHIFGSTETVRSHNTVRAAERLLYDIDIQHYVTMTMDAIVKINDAVGGISLPLLADFTHIDPSYTEGASVTLQGDFALTYIRARSEMEDKTNLARMERQKQYMEQLLSVYLRQLTADGLQQSVTAAEAAPYLHTDYTVHQLIRLGDKIRSYTFEGAQSVAGEAVRGEEFMEFYVDETALQETVLSLFYTPYDG